LPHLQADVESKTGKAPSPKTEGMEERKGGILTKIIIQTVRDVKWIGEEFKR